MFSGNIYLFQIYEPKIMKTSLQTYAVALMMFVITLPAYSFGDFFIGNSGQVVDNNNNLRKDILCYGTIKGYTVYVTGEGLSFVKVEREESRLDKYIAGKNQVDRSKEEMNRKVLVSRTDLPVPGLAGSSHEFPGKESCYFNYYLPQCKDGIVNVPAYRTVDYPGLGIEFTIRGGKLVIILDGEDGMPGQAELYKRLTAAVMEKKLEGCCRVEYAGETVPSDRDREEVQEFNYKVSWVSYFGGSDWDIIEEIDTDNDNNLIIGGCTGSQSFPTTAGCYQGKNEGNTDSFIAKFDENHQLTWCTLIGGQGLDHILSLDVSSDNSVCICGDSYNSPDYPASDYAYQKYYGGGNIDANFGVFSKDGHRNYLTLFGGIYEESFNKIKSDNQGNFFLCGESSSPDFPRTNTQKNVDTNDAVIVKFNKNYQLEYSGNFGGDDEELCHALGIDNDGNIIVSGSTLSKNFPLKNAIQTSKKDTSDTFIIKYDPDFNPIWSTYFGGSGIDLAIDLVTDSENNIIIKGCTTSKDFGVTNGAVQDKLIGNSDHYILKIDEDCKILWCTFFGGSDNITHWKYAGSGRNGIALDKNDNIAISDKTTSPDLYVSNDAIQKSLNGASDAFILLLDKYGRYIYSSFFGGSKDECSWDLIFNSANEIILAGQTNSSDLKVTEDAYQKSIYNSSASDGFVLIFSPNPDSCDETGFEYTDFTDDANISYAGKARRNNSIIRLTESEVNRLGAAWYKYQMPVRNGFTTEFSFRMSEGVNGVMSDSSCPGADGLAFVIQNKDTKAFGLPGGRLGYDPIPNSLAVEYDLFDNDEKQIESLNDPNGNHIAVMSMGKEANSSNHASGGELAIAPDIFEMNSNAAVYYSKIDYNVKAGTMRVYLSDNKDSYGAPVLSIDNPDLSKLLDLYEGEWAYVGFTSATGSSYQNHDILSWKFCPKPTDSQQTGVEEETPVSSNGLVFYPNPVEDYLNMNLWSTTGNISIYDLMGREVKSVPAEGNARIDVSGLSRGCYVVRVKYTNGQLFSGSFIKK